MGLSQTVDVAVVRVISCDFFGMTSKRNVLESASSVRLSVSVGSDLNTFMSSRAPSLTP